MPNNSNQQQQIIQSVGLSLLLAAMLWVLLLISAALQTGQLAGTYQVAIGPLVLNQIVRLTSENGVAVSFSFEKGLPFYLLLFAVIGAVIGYYRTQRS